MFTRRKFGWDLKQFSYFQFTDVLIIIFGNVIGIPILKQVSAGDFISSTIGTISSLFHNFRYSTVRTLP